MASPEKASVASQMFDVVVIGGGISGQCGLQRQLQGLWPALGGRLAIAPWLFAGGRGRGGLPPACRSAVAQQRPACILRGGPGGWGGFAGGVKRGRQEHSFYYYYY